MKINARLNSRDINNVINQVEQFKRSFQRKMRRFVEELADVGIEVIEQNIKVEYDDEVRNFGDYVTFQKPVSEIGGDVVCVITAEGQHYYKEWIGGSALVNPLLMAEFGSGVFAGEHKGSFPSATAKEHTDDPPWFWRDTGGRLHSSSGSAPTRPMLKAKEEMEKQIQTVAERVFGA